MPPNRLRRLPLRGRIPPGFSGNAVAVALSTGSKAAAYLIAGIALARTAGAAELGVFTVALTTGLLTMRIAELGVATIVVRDTARRPDDAGALLRAGLRVRAATVVVVAAGIVTVAAVLGYTGARLVALVLVGGYVVADSMARVVFATAHGRSRMVEEARIVVPASAVMALLGVVVAVRGGGAAAVGAVFLVVAVAMFAVALADVGRRAGGTGRGSWAAARAIVAAGWPIGLAGLAAFVYARIDLLLVAGLAGDTPAGEYAMAANLLAGPALIVWAVAAAAFPGLAAASTPAALRRHWSALAVPALGVGAVLVLVVPVAAVIIEVIYATTSPAAVGALRWLLLAQVAGSVVAVNGTVLNATDGERIGLAVVLVGVAVDVGLDLWAIPRWGPPGAAAATFVTEVLLAGVGTWLVARHLRRRSGRVA